MVTTSFQQDNILCLNDIEIIKTPHTFIRIPIFFSLYEGKIMAGKKILLLKDIRKDIPYYSLEEGKCPQCSFEWGVVAKAKNHVFWVCCGPQCLLKNVLGEIKSPLSISTQRRLA